MTRNDWLASHPYLQPVASLQAMIDAAAVGIEVPAAALPDWAAYRDDYHAGVPLLRSAAAAIDPRAAQPAVLTLIGRLASMPLPGALAEQCRALLADVQAAENAPDAALDLFDADSTASYSGLLRFVGCTVLARHLAPVVAAFGTWRDEDRWLRPYCPTCGERPAMAQLIGVEPGRLRLLVCGCCRTRWRYRRTMCPFCECHDDHRLAVVAIEEEGGLRIDYCESCRGYLKTYNGEGSEQVLLADWTSLHLDLLARDRGLQRMASSLYEL